LKMQCKTSTMNVQALQPRGRFMWSSPLVTEPTVGRVPRFWHIIKSPERLTYAPAVELRYLGEMAVLDIAEIVAIYLSVT